MYNVASTRESGAIKRVMNWFREVLCKTGEELDFCWIERYEHCIKKYQTAKFWTPGVAVGTANEQLSPGISLEHENQG